MLTRSTPHLSTKPLGTTSSRSPMVINTDVAAAGLTAVASSPPACKPSSKSPADTATAPPKGVFLARARLRTSSSAAVPPWEKPNSWMRRSCQPPASRSASIRDSKSCSVVARLSTRRRSPGRPWCCWKQIKTHENIGILGICCLCCEPMTGCTHAAQLYLAIKTNNSTRMRI